MSLTRTKCELVFWLINVHSMLYCALCCIRTRTISRVPPNLDVWLPRTDTVNTQRHLPHNLTSRETFISSCIACLAADKFRCVMPTELAFASNARVTAPLKSTTEKHSLQSIPTTSRSSSDEPPVPEPSIVSRSL